MPRWTVENTKTVTRSNVKSVRSRQSKSHQGLPRVIGSQNPSFLLGSPEERYPQRPTSLHEGEATAAGVHTTLVHPFVSTGKMGVSNPMTETIRIRKERLVRSNAIRLDPRETWRRVVLHVKHIVMVEEVGGRNKKRTPILGYTSIHVDTWRWWCSGLLDESREKRSPRNSSKMEETWRIASFSSFSFFFVLREFIVTWCWAN